MPEYRKNRAYDRSVPIETDDTYDIRFQTLNLMSLGNSRLLAGVTFLLKQLME